MKSQVEQRFAAESNAYAALKKQAEAAAVQWRYSQGRLWSFDPGDAEILTKEEVADAQEAEYAYGYDASGRVVCICQFTTDRTYKQTAAGELETVLTKRPYT